jgi:hypothetical protein
MLIIGCDYHPSVQQIAFVDSETGECEERRLLWTSPFPARKPGGGRNSRIAVWSKIILVAKGELCRPNNVRIYIVDNVLSI